MKKSLLFIIVLSATAMLYSACKKKSGPSMNYIVNGVADINIRQYVDTSIVVGLVAEYLSGPQETLTITPTSLPAGVTVTPASISGIPGFGAGFTFHLFEGTAGTFPVTVTAKTGSSTKTFTFNVIAASNIDCGQAYDGSYRMATSDDSTVNTTVYTVLYDSVNKLLLPPPPGVWFSLKGRVNCAAQTITTDSSSVDQLSAGTGTVTSNSITVTLRRWSGSTPETITITYTKI